MEGLLRMCVGSNSEADFFEWMSKQRRKLILCETTEQKTFVSAFLNGIELCREYGFTGHCSTGSRCQKIHHCCYHFLFKCSFQRKGKCSQKGGLSHDLYDEHNKRVIDLHKISDLHSLLIIEGLRYLFKARRIDETIESRNISSIDVDEKRTAAVLPIEQLQGNILYV